MLEETNTEHMEHGYLSKKSTIFNSEFDHPEHREDWTLDDTNLSSRFSLVVAGLEAPLSSFLNDTHITDPSETAKAIMLIFSSQHLSSIYLASAVFLIRNSSLNFNKCYIAIVCISLLHCNIRACNHCTTTSEH